MQTLFGILRLSAMSNPQHHLALSARMVSCCGESLLVLTTQYLKQTVSAWEAFAVLCSCNCFTLLALPQIQCNFSTWSSRSANPRLEGNRSFAKSLQIYDSTIIVWVYSCILFLMSLLHPFNRWEVYVVKFSDKQQEYLAAVHNVIRALLATREMAEDWH